MHGVSRSPEPDFLARLRAIPTQWDDLDVADQRRVRDALRTDFGQCCAYCENRCAVSVDQPNRESVDHFRPRSKFPNQSLDWFKPSVRLPTLQQHERQPLAGGI